MKTTPRPRMRRRRDGGAVLMVVMLVMLCLLGLGVTVLWNTTGNLQDPTAQYVLFAPPAGYPLSDRILLLRCRTAPREVPVPGPMLLFIGAFDRPEVILDDSRDTTYLALKYPATNWDELTSVIPSMDKPG